MADHEEPQSPRDSQKVDDSPAASDKESEDNFEDVPEAGTPETRSLTGRKPSFQAIPQTSSEKTDAVAEINSPTSSPAINGDGASEHETDENVKNEEPDKDNEKPVTASNRLSTPASLDNVNLDDELAAEHKDSPPPPPPPEKHHPQASRGISLSSITNSFSMPWSPSAPDTPPKGSPSPPAIPAVSTTSPSPPPPPRKGPFSWLSRNSTHKEVSSPPSTSPRRNTASSIATLTSNPEMTLSKLEEGVEANGRPSKKTLKDQFKLVRMREEAGVTLPEGDEDGKSQGAVVGLTPSGESGADGKPSASPLANSTNPSLAPGTASGVSAGPSDMADAQVDWDLWQSVVYEGPAAVARTSAEELNRSIATGIPNVIRGVIWQVLAQSKNDQLEIVYRELVARGTDKEKDRASIATSLSMSSSGTRSIDKDAATSSSSSVHSDASGPSSMKSPPIPPEKDSETIMKAQAIATADRKKRAKEDAAMLHRLEKTIRRDLGARTSYSKYAAAAGLQDGLFGVCKAYALYDEGVGYAQGMNFLVMPLLFNMPEEEAFCLLVRLMNHYGLRDLFIQDMPGLHMHLYQFERLLEDFEPALYCHLHRKGISPHLYATQWFLTLFAYRFPLQLVLRIYDLILSEGLSAILKFGIVLMQKNAETLLGLSDMSQLTTYLKDKVFDVYIDQAPSAGSILENGFFGSSSSNIEKEVYRADQLVRDACDVKITPEILKVYQAEWEEKTREERERQRELDHLKQSNLSYMIQVRKLEERIEACDHEQASMANDLVRTKIDNENLTDENESLKGQVKELREIIEKQPLEIEETWKAERDDLMKRNQRVHEENQRLEKELGDLEEELVQTKMKYAEINTEHETLQRKWADLRKQFA